MLDLCHVFQLVVDRFYYGPFSEQHFVGHGHQRVLHLVFQLGYQLNAINKEFAEQIFADVSAVANELAVDFLDEAVAFQRLTVIHIARCECEIDSLTFLVAYQMQFEAVEPPHRAFAQLGQTLESLVLQYSLAATHAQRRAVDETDACAFAHQHCLDEDNQLDDSDFLQLHKTIVRNHFREQVAHMIAHMLVEMLQTSETRVVERYHDGHHLRVGHAAVAVIAALAEAFGGL